MPILKNANVKGKTCGQLAINVLQIILALATNSTHIDVIFDVYANNSIETAEPLNIARSGTLTFQ